MPCRRSRSTRVAAACRGPGRRRQSRRSPRRRARRGPACGPAPSSSSQAARAAPASRDARSSNSRWLPSRTRAPSTRPSAPRPASDCTSVAGGRRDTGGASAYSQNRLRRSGARSGVRSTPRARRSRSGAMPFNAIDADDFRRAPRQRAGLVERDAPHAAARSRCAPPLISTPFRAAPASAATIDTGVEITSAHGQETTSSTSAR